MQAQRYFVTPLLTVLIWMFLVGAENNPIFEILRQSAYLAVMLGVALYASSLFAIRIADVFCSWSSRSFSLVDMTALLARFGIAFVTTLLFCLPLTLSLSRVLNIELKYVDMLVSQGMVIFLVAWIATMIVDFFLRAPQTR